jgi:hypothetical protein
MLCWSIQRLFAGVINKVEAYSATVESRTNSTRGASKSKSMKFVGSIRTILFNTSTNIHRYIDRWPRQPELISTSGVYKSIHIKKFYSWLHKTLATPIARLVGNLGTITPIHTRSPSWLETGQSNSKVSHEIIEIRYEIPNQVRKQVTLDSRAFDSK